MEYQEFNINPFTVRYMIDASYLCRHTVYYQKRIKRLVVFMLVYMGLCLLLLISRNVCVFSHYGYLYISDALPTMFFLVAWGVLVWNEYQMLCKNKVSKAIEWYLRYIFKKKYHDSDSIECNYYFCEQSYTRSCTPAHRKNTRKFCRTKKLYITDDIICDGFYLYIERTSVTEEVFLHIKTFLERRIPSYRIYHKLP